VEGAPDVVPIGGSVRLCSLRSLARSLGLSEQETWPLLEKLRVPVVVVRETTYFNLPALEFVLYVLTQFGGPGWSGRAIDPETVGAGDTEATRLDMEIVARVFGHLEREAILERCRATGQQLRKALQRAAKQARSVRRPKKTRASRNTIRQGT